jgi:hypothetical protein
VPDVRQLDRPLLPGLAGGLPESQLSLLDLADRLLNRGVVVAGEATISVAGIDLIYLGLNLVLASVETLRSGAGMAAQVPGTGPDRGREVDPRASAPDPPIPPSPHRPLPASPPPPGPASSVSPPPGSPPPNPRPASTGSLDLDPDRMEEGLARLVLTLVELIRQLLERQAIRRMDGGSLSEAEVERLGLALMRLQEKLHEMAAAFGLQPDDLNINLGPLGNLL